MTQEELNEIEESMESFDDCYGTSFAFACQNECNLIMDACEKQVAKKPIFVDAHPNHLYFCPSCNSTFIVRNNVAMNYCNNCGQRILFDRGMVE